MADLAGRRLALVLGSSTGGVGAHVASLLPGLLARGAVLTVLGPATTDELFGFRRAGVVFTPVEIAVGPRPVQDARAAVALRRLTRGADLVHAHGFRAGLLAGLVRPAGMPAVLTLHNAVLATGPRRVILGRLEWLAVRRADVVLAASADLAVRARALGARDVRFAPVAAPPLPAAVRTVEAVRAEVGAEARPLLLAVGRLHPQKGFDVLLDATLRLAVRQPPPLTVIAGDGPLEAELAARISATGAPVRLLGRRTDVADLLASADVVVLPSRWEARALVAQETLRAGRPLVATAVGGLPELLGDAALLVPPEDPGALAAAVASLLDDPTRATALAQRGRLRAAHFPDAAAMVDSLAAMYAELLR